MGTCGKIDGAAPGFKYRLIKVVFLEMLESNDCATKSSSLKCLEHNTEWSEGVKSCRHILDSQICNNSGLLLGNLWNDMSALLVELEVYPLKHPTAEHLFGILENRLRQKRH